jgi:hypothetical protein
VGQFMLFVFILLGGGVIVFFLFHLLSKLKANFFKKKKVDQFKDFADAKELAIPDTATLDN